MRKFTTVCDSKYLPQGLALYNSLIKVNPNFQLYWLCIDDKAHEILSKLNLKNVEIQKATEIIPHTEMSYREYCWSLGAKFTWWVLLKYNMSDITYIDADLYFYSDYEEIYNEIENSKSTATVENRVKKIDNVGRYNVAFNYFKNDGIGNDCLKRWSELVGNTNNEYYATHGSCGDQKYIELFEIWHPDSVHIINNGHGAWWNNRSNKYYDDIVVWDGNGIGRKLIYMHYSHVKLTETGYTHDEMREMSPRLKEYYDNYMDEIRKLTNELQDE